MNIKIHVSKFQLVVLTAVVVVSFFGVASYANADINSGIVARYTFDSSNGTDATGNGYDAQNFGVTYNSGCAVFDGTTSHMLAPNGAGLPTGGAARSITYWFNAPIYQFAGAIVGLGTNQAGSGKQDFLLGPIRADAGSESYCLFGDTYHAENNICFPGGAFTTPTQKTDSPLPTLSTWHALAFNYDGAQNYQYFLDGKLIKSGHFPSPINTTTNALRIGKDDSFVYQWPGPGFYKGQLDDVRIYNRTLSNQEVAQIAATGPTCSPSSAIVITPVTPTCTTNADCGAPGYTGSNVCQGNSVYKNYTTYTCNNPGASNSSCSNSMAPQLQTNCSGSQTCSGGSCTANSTGACSNNIQCGTNGVTGSPFCQGNGVYQNFTTYTCNNAGSANSGCSNSTVAQLQTTCAFGGSCANGSCNTVQNTCVQNSFQRCVGSAVYWFDSCGNQQSLAQTCSGSQTCSGNTCVNTTINCTSNAFQKCAGNNVYWYDSCGNQQALAQVCNGSQTCSGSTCVNSFINLSVNQKSVLVQVRNLSSGNLNWSNSVTAGPGDILQFSITVGSTGQTFNNFTVQDTLPANLIYNNNLTLDGVSYPGNITSGITISLTPGQAHTITYQVQVAGDQSFSFGTTTLTNSVMVGNPSAGSASIVVTKTGVQGASTISTGLTDNLWADSFFIPLLIALIGIWLYKSGYVGVPEWVGSTKKKNLEAKAEKTLQNRINQIKQQELS